MPGHITRFFLNKAMPNNYSRFHTCYSFFADSTTGINLNYLFANRKKNLESLNDDVALIEQLLFELACVLYTWSEGFGLCPSLGFTTISLFSVVVQEFFFNFCFIKFFVSY